MPGVFFIGCTKLGHSNVIPTTNIPIHMLLSGINCILFIIQLGHFHESYIISSHMSRPGNHHWARRKLILHWEISQWEPWPGKIYQTETRSSCAAIWWPRLRCVRGGPCKAERKRSLRSLARWHCPTCRRILLFRWSVLSFSLLLFSFSGMKSGYSVSSILSMLK